MGERFIHLRNDVHLADLTVNHAQDMYRWMLDPMVRDNIGLRTEPSLERTVTWLNRALQDPSIVAHAIIRDGHHIGNTVLDQLDRHISKARFSIYIGEKWARGNNTGITATYLTLSKAFQELKLHKVWLIAHEYNTRAINTYTSIGFTTEGLLRDEFVIDNRHINVLYMGILETEFSHIKTTDRQHT